jgi:hypothetical protein
MEHACLLQSVLSILNVLLNAVQRPMWDMSVAAFALNTCVKLQMHRKQHIGIVFAFSIKRSALSLLYYYLKLPITHYST